MVHLAEEDPITRLTKAVKSTNSTISSGPLMPEDRSRSAPADGDDGSQTAVLEKADELGGHKDQGDIGAHGGHIFFQLGTDRAAAGVGTRHPSIDH